MGIVRLERYRYRSTMDMSKSEAQCSDAYTSILGLDSVRKLWMFCLTYGTERSMSQALIEVLASVRIRKEE